MIGLHIIVLIVGILIGGLTQWAVDRTKKKEQRSSWQRIAFPCDFAWDSPPNIKEGEMSLYVYVDNGIVTQTWGHMLVDKALLYEDGARGVTNYMLGTPTCYTHPPDIRAEDK